MAKIALLAAAAVVTLAHAAEFTLPRSAAPFAGSRSKAHGVRIHRDVQVDISGLQRVDVSILSQDGAFQPSTFGYGGAPDVFEASALDFRAVLSFAGDTPRVLCVIDGRAVFDSVADATTDLSALTCLRASATLLECNCTLDARLSLGHHTVAMYAAPAGAVVSGARLLSPPLTAKLVLPASATAPTAGGSLLQRGLNGNKFLRAATPAGSGILGIYYTTYQQISASMYQNVSRYLGRNASSVEETFRNASAHLADGLWRWQPYVADPKYVNQTGLFQHQPALGYYCYYRKRGNETYGYIPDCPEASNVLRTHAAEMASAGFEYITPDATNWEQDPRNISDGSDLYQLRPTEVLAEEWLAMRQEGAATPQLGTDDLVTIRCQSNCLYNWYLSEFFNNASYLDADMIWTTPDGANEIYLVVYNSAAMDMQAIEAIGINGGRNNILTPTNWAAPGPDVAYYNNGIWTYFAPCVANVSGSPVFTNDGPIDLDVPCAHFKTRNSVIGDAWTVSTTNAMTNNPFGMSTKLNGLHLKKQFYDVFADPLVDYIWMPSWSEFMVSPNPMAGWDMTNPWFYSVGLQPDDPDRYLMFYDGWGAERSRTVEPSVEDDGYYYELVASCMRVYRLTVALALPANGTGCAVAGEECCVIRENEVFTRVWSVVRTDVNDSSVTNDAGEFAALRAANWSEVCSPWAQVANGQATSFCTNGQAPWLNASDPTAYAAAVRGPFIAYANVSDAIPATHALYRCVNATGAWPRHFVSADAGCSGMGDREYTVAYVGDTRDGLLLREVRRCWAPAAAGGVGIWYHAVNGPCFPGDADQGIQGFVV